MPTRLPQLGLLLCRIALGAVCCPLAQTSSLAGGPNAIALHGFAATANGINSDGANPAAALVLSGGVLCGTTLNGGTQGVGTAFSMTPDGSNFNAFHSFANSPDAANSRSELAFSGGTFWGASLAGGSNGVGTVFLGGTNGSASTVRSFSPLSADNATNSGGASPGAWVVVSGPALYGTTTAGGSAASGTIFSLGTNGLGFSLLHNFSALDSNTGTNADGALPCGGFALYGGTLYGTASAGGAGGAGVVYSINTNGTNFTTLYSFTPLDSLAATNTDGAFPLSGLVLSNGTLYGTTIAGGTGGKGAIFSISTDGTGFSVLHSFSPTDPLTGSNLDGASPCAPLVLAGASAYGTASAGGTGASGSVFSVGTNGGQFQALHAFSAINPSTGTNVDGATPIAGLLLLGNSLYGTAFAGGTGAEGTVFSVAISFPPALITGIVLNSNGSVSLSFLGGPNSTNVIQAAANLTPPAAWQNLSTNVADATGAWQFTESNATNAARFYRSYAPSH